MSLHNRRTITIEEPPAFRVECHGHHDAILFVTFMIQWSDGQRQTCEWSMPMKGSVVVKEEWIDLNPREAPVIEG